MPQSLYQKYRPQTWADVTDQNHVKVTLGHEITRGQISHAYLFIGPRGVGKTTIARLLAKSVNCENRKEDSPEPCNECQACKRMSSGQSFDIIEIDAASHTGVDNIRENVLETATVTAGHGKYRVFIIDEVHMLSTAAFNAMLKMLEEPPEHVIFILATTEVHKVPATIISRCERYDFKRIPADAIRERLQVLSEREGVKVDKEVLTAVAEHAEGSLRDAESRLGQVLSLGLKEVTFDEATLVLPRSDLATVSELIQFCLEKRVGDALKLINTFVEQGGSITVLMYDCLQWLRTLLLLKASQQLDMFSVTAVGERQQLLLKQAELLTIQEARRMLDIFMARRRLIAESPIAQLPIELAVIEIISDGGIGGSGGAMKPIPQPTQVQPAIPPTAPTTPVAEQEKKPKKVEKSEPEKNVSHGKGDLNLAAEELQTRWGSILDKVKEHNHSLSFVLASTVPMQVRQGSLEVKVQYAFHRDRIDEPKNRKLISEAASDVLGSLVVVEPILND